MKKRGWKTNQCSNLVIFLVIFIIATSLIPLISAPDSVFDEKKIDSWINDINKFQALSPEMKKKVWDDPATTVDKKIGFINQYAKKLGLSISIKGIDAKGLVWGEEGVFGFKDGSFLDFTRLKELKEVSSVEFKDNKIIYVFKDGSQFSHDQGYLRPEDKTLLSTKDGKYDGFKWNGKGKAEFVNNEIKLEKGSSFTKTINGREVAFSQFYYSGNPKKDYNSEKDEPGILRLNSEGFFEGKNINAKVDGIEFYTAKSGFTKLMGNFFKEDSSIAETAGAWGTSLFKRLVAPNGPKDNGDFIKADMQNNKVFIEMGGKQFGFVDVTDSKDQIGQVYMKGDSLYFKSGDLIISEKNGKLSFNSVSGITAKTSNGMLIINGNELKNARMLEVSDNGVYSLFDPEMRAVINGAENLVKTRRGKVLGDALSITVEGKEKDKRQYYSSDEDYRQALFNDPTLKVTFETNPVTALGINILSPSELIGDEMVKEIGKRLAQEAIDAGGFEQLKTQVALASNIGGILPQEQVDGIALFNAFYDTNGNVNPKGDVANLRNFISQQNRVVYNVVIDKANKDIYVDGNSFRKTYPNTNPNFIVGLADNLAIDPPSKDRLFISAIQEISQYGRVLSYRARKN